VENSRRSDGELQEFRGLVARIKRGDCVLVLGPGIAVRVDDPERRPLEELLAEELLANAGATGPATLRTAADLYFHHVEMHEILEFTVRDFYEREATTPTDFHRDLAALPFRLCVSASPDNLMFRAFEDAGKAPQRSYYDFHGPVAAKLQAPTVEQPLLYHLFGHCDDPASLVLTERDLIEFLIAVVKETPPVPDQVRSILADEAVSFLFLGFGFQNWYLRVLLQALKVYDRRSKTLAFENKKFFDDPDHERAVAFFADRRIDFRSLRWEDFARQLRTTYEAETQRSPTPSARTAPPLATAPVSRGPKAFVSYASEDRAAVEELAAQLEARGIDVWQDTQDLRAGDNWDNTLKDVIRRRVDYMIVVQTPAMTSRVEGVFHREIETALQRQNDMGEVDGQRLRFLIPVRIGPCNVLSALRNAHVIDVGAPAGIDALVASIDEDWQRRLALKRSVA